MSLFPWILIMIICSSKASFVISPMNVFRNCLNQGKRIQNCWGPQLLLLLLHIIFCLTFCYSNLTPRAVEVLFSSSSHPCYSQMPNKWKGPNKRAGQIKLLIYYMKIIRHNAFFFIFNMKNSVRIGRKSYQKSINRNTRL